MAAGMGGGDPRYSDGSKRSAEGPSNLPEINTFAGIALGLGVLIFLILMAELYDAVYPS
jgi:hypothetical protein